MSTLYIYYRRLHVSRKLMLKSADTSSCNTVQALLWLLQNRWELAILRHVIQCFHIQISAGIRLCLSPSFLINSHSVPGALVWKSLSKALGNTFIRRDSPLTSCQDICTHDGMGITGNHPTFKWRQFMSQPWSLTTGTLQMPVMSSGHKCRGLWERRNLALRHVAHLFILEQESQLHSSCRRKRAAPTAFENIYMAQVALEKEKNL